MSQAHGNHTFCWSPREAGIIVKRVDRKCRGPVACMLIRKEITSLARNQQPRRSEPNSWVGTLDVTSLLTLPSDEIEEIQSRYQVNPGEFANSLSARQQ